MLAVRAARLFDGERNQLVQRPLVLIEDGRIIAVEQGDVGAPEGASTLDLGDVTLLPGLIDVHQHLGFDAGPAPVAQMNADDNTTLLLRMARHAGAALHGGVTTLRDLGDRDFLALPLRDWYRAGGEIGPEILAAGPPITTTGGHCYFMHGEADGELGVRLAVRERVKRGVDAIKVMATGGHMTPGSNPYAIQYSVAELRAIVEEGHRLGKRVTAHAHAVAGIGSALAAGVDSIEHGSFQTENGIVADERLIAGLAEAGIYVAPTISRPPANGGLPGTQEQRTARAALIERMYRAGVKLVIGTDAGISGVPHDSAPYGIVALAGFGLPAAAALAAGTSVAAASIGLGGRKGRIAPGHDADLLAVAGDPLTDPRALLDVRAVFRGGVRVR